MKKITSALLVVVLLIATISINQTVVNAANVEVATTGLKSASAKTQGEPYKGYTSKPGFTVKESSRSHKEFEFYFQNNRVVGAGVSEKARLYASLGDNHHWVRLAEVSAYSSSRLPQKIILDNKFFKNSSTAGNLAKYGKKVKIYFTVRGWAPATAGGFNTSYHTGVYLEYNTQDLAPTIRPAGTSIFDRDYKKSPLSRYHDWIIDVPWIDKGNSNQYMFMVYTKQNGTWKQLGTSYIYGDQGSIQLDSATLGSNGAYELTVRVIDAYGRWESCFIGGAMAINYSSNTTQISNLYSL